MHICVGKSLKDTTIGAAVTLVIENYVCSTSVKDVGGRGINLRVITYQWDETDDNLSPKGHFNTVCLSLVGLLHLKGDFIFIAPKSGFNLKYLLIDVVYFPT